MKCIKVEPHKKPEVIESDFGLKALQEAVDGYIECIYPFEDDVAIIANEEGKLLGLAPNRALYDDDGEMYDIICGTFIIAGVGDDSFTELPEEMIEKYLRRFGSPEIFVNLSGHIIVIKED